MSNKSNYFYEFGEFRYSPKERCLWKNDELLSLSPKALDVLDLLLENHSNVVSREEIIERVWEDSFVEEANINVAISNLRKTLGQDKEQTFIKTVPKKGYRFVADIEKVFDDKAEPTSFGIQKQDLKLSDNSSQQLVTRKTPLRWHFVAIILLGVFFLTSFGVWVNYWSEDGLSTIPANKRNIKSVAVLPLKDLGETEKIRTLSLGMTDSLISRLGKLNRFAVRPLSAVENFADGEKDAIEFGKELQVDAILVGTIQTDNDRLRANVRLLDVRDGAQIWSKSYDETEADLFKLQDDLSLQVADNIISELNGGETQQLTKKETQNVDAFREYSKGQFYLAKRTNADIEKAIVHFEKATELDENYASAYTNLADSYMLLSDSVFGRYKASEVIDRVRPLITRAMELNPDSAETYNSKGFLEFNLEWKVYASEKSYKKSIKINPNLAQTRHWYAWSLIAQKRFEDAEEQFGKAYEVDPTSRIIAAEIGLPKLYSGEIEESIPTFRQAVEMDGNFFQSRFRLWYALFYAGKYDEALIECEEMRRLSSDDFPFYQAARAMTLARTDDEQQAIKIYASLEQRSKSSEYIMPMLLAAIATQLDDKPSAYKWLEVAFDERNEYLLYLDIVPDFKSLQNDPEFAELLGKVNDIRARS